jgi:hypothetical protein
MLNTVYSEILFVNFIEYSEGDSQLRTPNKHVSSREAQWAYIQLYFFKQEMFTWLNNWRKIIGYFVTKNATKTYRKWKRASTMGKRCSSTWHVMRCSSFYMGKETLSLHSMKVNRNYCIGLDLQFRCLQSEFYNRTWRHKVETLS